jgi:hypothetical protein
VENAAEVFALLFDREIFRTAAKKPLRKKPRAG